MLAPEFVLPLLRTHELAAHEVYTFGGVAYPFALVMQCGEEDLSGAIAHARMTARMPCSSISPLLATRTAHRDCTAAAVAFTNT